MTLKPLPAFSGLASGIVASLGMAALLALAAPVPGHAQADTGIAPVQADGGIVFTRMGFSLWLPENFGAPAFEQGDEISWLSPGLAETGKGIGVIFGAVPERGIVLDGLGPDDEISRDSLTLNAQVFDRVHYQIPAEDVIGTFYLSQEAFHEGNFLAFMIATQPDHWNAMRSLHDTIAERIESLNSN
ncbi:MAG: hypothetical protein JJU15_08215 [Pararhodobacter sp.]|nr:hypothetical protein [Pararhodobacter sp.]